MKPITPSQRRALEAVRSASIVCCAGRYYTLGRRHARVRRDVLSGIVREGLAEPMNLPNGQLLVLTDAGRKRLSC
jgi:hypothetical protein